MLLFSILEYSRDYDANCEMKLEQVVTTPPPPKKNNKKKKKKDKKTFNVISKKKKKKIFLPPPPPPPTPKNSIKNKKDGQQILYGICNKQRKNKKENNTHIWCLDNQTRHWISLPLALIFHSVLSHNCVCSLSFSPFFLMWYWFPLSPRSMLCFVP